MRINKIREIIKEEFKKHHFYKKYSYGLENIPDENKKDFNNIIGHTWLTHVKRKDSALNEIGKVLWHSLNGSGQIKYYDVKWSNGRIDINIPATLLEKVKDSSDINELHEEHGVEGHEEDLKPSKRRYKKWISKKTR